MAAVESKMQPYTDAAIDRIRCTLLLLGREEFRKRLSGGEELHSRCLSQTDFACSGPHGNGNRDIALVRRAAMLGQRQR